MSSWADEVEAEEARGTLRTPTIPKTLQVLLKNQTVPKFSLDKDTSNNGAEKQTYNFNSFASKENTNNNNSISNRDRKQQNNKENKPATIQQNQPYQKPLQPRYQQNRFQKTPFPTAQPLQQNQPLVQQQKPILNIQKSYPLHPLRNSYSHPQHNRANQVGQVPLSFQPSQPSALPAPHSQLPPYQPHQPHPYLEIKQLQPIQPPTPEIQPPQKQECNEPPMDQLTQQPQQQVGQQEEVQTLQKSSSGKESKEGKEIRKNNYHRRYGQKPPQNVSESDMMRRLQQRQKQIDFGKNTPGYKRYAAEIPKNGRMKSHPRTPDIRRNCSKRSWDGQVRVWRRALHFWDPVDLKLNGDDDILEDEEEEQNLALEGEAGYGFEEEENEVTTYNNNTEEPQQGESEQVCDNYCETTSMNVDYDLEQEW